MNPRAPMDHSFRAGLVRAIGRVAALGWVLALLNGCATLGEGEARESVRFVVLGDAPYNGREEALFARTMTEIGQLSHDFVVHVGDIKDGSSQPCDDALYRARRAVFSESAKPFVLLAGDNDWTDCRRPGAGGYAPLERLARLREIFFAPAVNLAMPLGVTHHPGLPELMAWRVRQVEFVALHVVGSRDNQGFDADGDREQAARMAANLAWLAAAARRADTSQARALVVMFHVNPVFEMPPAVYQPLIDTLAEIARASPGRPLLIIHGDTHTYQFNQALIDGRTGQPFPNGWRLESTGSPQVGMVTVSIEGRPAQITVEAWIAPSD